MQGKFITLEGIEGSGKSTSIKDIKNILDLHSIDHIVTKEPGGGPIGQDLRALLLNKDSKSLYQKSFLFCVQILVW